MTLTELRNQLSKNVCEVVFRRRRPVQGKPAYRRMLCTLNENILNSANGRLSLNYKPPVGGPKYSTADKNLLLVWDIFMQDWRMVSLDDCRVVNEIKEEEFWKYFNEVLIPMSLEEKVQFMNQ